MDRDVSERAMRIVGQLQCLNSAAKAVEVMPCDKRTAELLIGMLHFLVPLPPAGTAIEHVYGVTTGPNYRIRAFTIFRRAQQDLGFANTSGEK